MQPRQTFQYTLKLLSNEDLSKSTVFQFDLLDFGQFIVHPESGAELGSSCLLICLAACLQVPPAAMLTYAEARSNMLQHDLELYAKHEELQFEWEVFCLECTRAQLSPLLFPCPET